MDGLQALQVMVQFLGIIVTLLVLIVTLIIELFKKGTKK